MDPVDTFYQEFADCNYKVMRRSLKEQLFGMEAQLPRQHGVFYIGQILLSTVLHTVKHIAPKTAYILLFRSCV